jgi:hypothetical protein
LIVDMTVVEARSGQETGMGKKGGSTMKPPKPPKPPKGGGKGTKKGGY